MENFKEIAEKCLAGGLSGTFVLNNSNEVHSKCLVKTGLSVYPYSLNNRCYSVCGNCYNGGLAQVDYNIVGFIQDMKKEQITINIPEGMEAVQETVNGEIRIKFVEKKLTLADIPDSISNFCNAYHYKHDENTSRFYKKVEVIRKLTNIRNYFGKPDSYERGCCVCYDSYNNKFYAGNINTIGIWTKDIVFKEKEHAEQAIKMLDGELKYLFEPW